MRPGDGLAFEPPRPLFSTRDYTSGVLSYDIAADNQSFVFIKSTGVAREETPILVLNFFEELKAKVGN